MLLLDKAFTIIKQGTITLNFSKKNEIKTVIAGFMLRHNQNHNNSEEGRFYRTLRKLAPSEVFLRNFLTFQVTYLKVRIMVRYAFEKFATASNNSYA